MDLDKLVMLSYDSRIVIGKREYETPDNITVSNSLHISKKVHVKKRGQAEPYLPNITWNDTIIPVREGYKYTVARLNSTYSKEGATKYVSLINIKSVLESMGFDSLAKKLE